jgi:DNA-binding GntR family transcriptional regulator
MPHKGVFVADLNAIDIEETLEIRLALESAAANVAARRITNWALSKLKKIDKLLDSMVRNRDGIITFKADSRLHNLIRIAPGNARAQSVINNLTGQIHRIQSISAHKPGRIETTIL